MDTALADQAGKFGNEILTGNAALNQTAQTVTGVLRDFRL
jgi:hypothetical protein